MLPDLPPPILIEDARGFQRLLSELERVREIAVDTEADSFYSYREKVCLIQISYEVGGEPVDHLVDPLAGFDLSALGRVLADPARVKVFHDGEYDILIMKRSYGFRFKNLFDTRVAAAALGSQNPGLANVLKERYSIELDKSMQRSNWAQRPLSDKQVRYARFDTRFLLPLMRQQQAELVKQDRGRFVEGECLRLEGIEPPDDRFDPDEFVKIKGSRALGPLERQVLRELYALREEHARDSDEPPFRIVNNETLLEIARVRPRSIHDLQQVQGFSWKQGRKMGDAVLEAVRRAVELGPLRKLPVLQSREGTDDFNDADIELHERLKDRRKELAIKLGLDSAYLLNRHLLVRIAREKPKTLEALAHIEGMQPWQAQEFGPALLEVLSSFERELASGAQPRPRRRAPWRG